MRLLTLFSFFLLATPALAIGPNMGGGYGSADAPRDIDPLALGQKFCDARISRDMRPLEHYFAPKLVRLIAGTPATELGTAIPWQGHGDLPSSCAVEIVNGFDDTIGVLVRISYRAPAAQWSDVLNLERTPTNWLINNVFYDGGGNLRFRLLEAGN